MNTIMRIKFGSHLYGTSTPASDIDYKSIFIPPAREIVLQDIREVITNQRPKQVGERNVAGDIDEEAFSLQKFLKLASEGQTVAMDLLFAPDWAHIIPPDPLWADIAANRSRLLTRKSASFVGYVKAQANKYGIRGSRVASSRAALSLLTRAMETSGAGAKLDLHAQEIHKLVASYDHMAILQDRTPNGQDIELWEVCDRKMPLTATIKNAHDIMQRLVGEYGKRALMAESNQGVDWKALSHAVRIGHQAVELLKTGQITFPLPDAKHVLDIKLGRLSYKDVADEIEGLLETVNAVAECSTLPEQPDYDWINSFVYEAYRTEVVKNG